LAACGDDGPRPYTNPPSSTGTGTNSSSSSSGGAGGSSVNGGAGGTTAPLGGSGGAGGSGQAGSAQGGSGPTGPAVQLVNLVNDYRTDNGLAAIPYSPSMSIVGDTHVHDLHDHQPHTVGDCNLHSWSEQGSWTACCYTPDHAQAQCMWDKPSELTSYTGNGYENAAYYSAGITPQYALDMWKNSPGHNAVILNQGQWASVTWQALGAGIYQGYAVIWFGQEVDPAN